MGPAALAQVLRPLTDMFRPADHPELLRGLSAPDDAAVWKLDDDRALVLTSDFFPPIVDDPVAFGAIAAANALSDVYAMGARPLFAINLVGFPADLDGAILTDILRGGAEVAREAGMVIAGGHTTTDAEPKYGLAVVGEVHPQRIWRNEGARVGDRLFLTKPLGTGLITTAARRDAADPRHLDSAVQSMRRLNRAAADVLSGLGEAVRAVTDVTGFGLLGHALEMADGCDVSLRIELRGIPLLEGARGYAEAGFAPGGTRRNLAHVRERVDGLDAAAEADAAMLGDPQTSGGLLVALDPAAVDALVARAAEADVPIWPIGRVEAGPARLRVV